jgi:isoquinoline 1-oxidoreductase alpha subunit
MTSFTVNGQPVHYRLHPDTPLLFALREASNLTGTKFGCGTGHCGACTVHVDGRAVKSCRVRIGDIEGTYVTTIEGLARDRSHAVQQALAAENVPQCGFCIPGIVMAVAALIEHEANPSDEAIDRAITNMCRCGIYPRLRGAIRRAIRIAGGRETVAAAPPPGISRADAAAQVPALRDEPPRRR